MRANERPAPTSSATRAGRAPAVGGQRGDADLLGEHRDAGRQSDVELVRADPADQRVGGDVGGRAVDDHQRLVGADVAGRAPVRLEQPPQRRGRSAGPTIEEQRRPCRRARSAKARDGVGAGATGTRLAPA